jgi:hypothetical protein
MIRRGVAPERCRADVQDRRELQLARVSCGPDYASDDSGTRRNALFPNQEIVMRTPQILVLLTCAAMMLPSLAGAQKTAEQQQNDEAQCSAQAVQQSGYDPANPPSTAAAQPAPVTGSGTRAKGAAAGAAVGAIGGNDVGNAAAKGAVVGGVAQRNRNRNAAADQNAAAAQNQQAGAAAYQNARKACLQGRGYP